MLDQNAPSILRAHAWGEVRFVRCRNCGTWCQSPQIVLASLAQWYDSNEYQGCSGQAGSAYLNYLQDEPHRLREARRRYLNDLAPYLPAAGARVLEIGCATGSLLAVLRDAGCEVHGLDLSPRFADTARSLYGLDVRTGALLSVCLPAQFFDMILMFGTISNLGDIPASLVRLRQALRPSGTLVFNYPIADSSIARLYGKRYWMFAPSVNSFMTGAGCTAAVRAARLSPTRYRIDRQMPSFSKILNHARAGLLLPVFDKLGLGNQSLPFAIPVPGIRIVWARVEDA